MRCHYMSDLHLESQDCDFRLPGGDVLLIAGDLCHARCLDPARADPYSVTQRSRVLRLRDALVKRFAHVLLVAGNHDHYDGVFDETVPLLRRHLPGVTVLDNQGVDIGGVRFFGMTLWTNFDDGNATAMDGVRRRMGEYFFVKVRSDAADDLQAFSKFQPETAASEFRKAWSQLQATLAAAPTMPTVVISHHAPSHQGLNPKFAGNGLDPAYASQLDPEIEKFPNVPFWVHGHTHIRRRYRIGATEVLANCRGFEGKDAAARGFSANAHFDL